jgi:hypothetical protein
MGKFVGRNKGMPNQDENRGFSFGVDANIFVAHGNIINPS